MKKWLGYPYIVWSVIFIIVPLLLIVIYGVTESSGSGIVFTTEFLQRAFEPMYKGILNKSFLLALICTVICLIIGYPFAYFLSTMKSHKRDIMYMLIIIPLWMNFLLRTYAWINILGKNGIINNILGVVGLGPYKMIGTEGAIVLGMVYNFLPFMILPIYTVLCKIDKNILNAARDLGANEKTVFKKIVLPLSIPGIISGITMVFMPAVSSFVISRLLGGSKYLIGNLIEDQFVTTGDWHFGSALSIILMIVILISMALIKKFDKDGGGQKVW